MLIQIINCCFSIYGQAGAFLYEAHQC